MLELLVSCGQIFCILKAIVVSISEILEERRNIAMNTRLGFHVTSPEEIEQHIDDDEFGFDIFLDCSGSPKCIEAAFKWTKFGATILCFGMCPKESQIEINPLDIMIKELKLFGSLINPFTFNASISVIDGMRSYLDYERLGVKIFTLQDYPVALESLKNGWASKSVFKMDFNVE